MLGTITVSMSILICEFGCDAWMYDKVERLRGVEESAGSEGVYICKSISWDGIKSPITVLVPVPLY